MSFFILFEIEEAVSTGRFFRPANVTQAFYQKTEKKSKSAKTLILRAFLRKKESQLSDLNRRPTVYKTVALPLS